MENRGVAEAVALVALSAERMRSGPAGAVAAVRLCGCILATILACASLAEGTAFVK